MKLNFIEKAVVKKVLKKLDGTDIATPVTRIPRNLTSIWAPLDWHAKRD